MNIRTFLGILGLAAALGAGNAFAQQGTVARLSNLEGNVMVSQGDGMVAAVRGQRVVSLIRGRAATKRPSCSTTIASSSAAGVNT